jgi:hypothetical protein
MSCYAALGRLGSCHSGRSSVRQVDNAQCSSRSASRRVCSTPSATAIRASAKRVRARYPAERHVIAERYVEWEITGPADTRRRGCGGSFNPYRMGHARGADAVGPNVPAPSRRNALLVLFVGALFPPRFADPRDRQESQTCRRRVGLLWPHRMARQLRPSRKMGRPAWLHRTPRMCLSSPLLFLHS